MNVCLHGTDARDKRPRCNITHRPFLLPAHAQGRARVSGVHRAGGTVCPWGKRRVPGLDMAHLGSAIGGWGQVFGSVV